MKKFYILLFLLIIFSVSGCDNKIIESDSQIKKNLSALKITSPIDKDNDGIDDYTDILEGARNQIGVVTEYDTNYYSAAYPPDNSGACADVFWRALNEAGYDFKDMLDNDIKNHTNDYPLEPKQDPNINFRRVRNIKNFLEKYSQDLTLEIKPNDEKNLVEWQAGDIVTYAQQPGGLWHIAIISDQRNNEGMPLLIHNYGFGVLENYLVTDWPTEITGHFRFNINSY